MMPSRLHHLVIAAATIYLTAHADAREEAEVRIDFSVHLLAPPAATGMDELARIDGLHYAYGELAVPLQLKEGRQSILYPYKGPARLTLFRFGAKQEDGESVHEPVVRADIPAGTEAAVLVLQQSGAGFRLKPFWFGSAELREPGFLVNLCEVPIGLQLDRKHRLQIAPARKLPLRPVFRADEHHAYLFLEAFLAGPKLGGRPRKSLETNLFFPKGETQLNILFDRGPGRISLVNLSARGIPNRFARAELERHIPALGQPDKPPGD